MPPPVTLLNFLANLSTNVTVAFKATVTFKRRQAQVVFYIAERITSLLCIDTVVVLDIQMSGATRTCFSTEVDEPDEALVSLPDRSSLQTQAADVIENLQQELSP